jgi:hypothetical protein
MLKREPIPPLNYKKIIERRDRTKHAKNYQENWKGA